MPNDPMKHLFAQVKRAKDEWLTVIDGVSDLVLLADSSGKILRCNRPFSEFLGRPYREILGRNWEELLREGGLETASAGPPLGQDQRELYQKASARTFLLSYRHPGNRHESGGVVTLQDISERKQALQKIEAYKGKLEKAIGELSVMIRHVTEYSGDAAVHFSLPSEFESCWKFLGCEQKACPCYGREPLHCWGVAGTRCREDGIKDCLSCPFYQEYADDPVVGIGIQFGQMMQLIEKKNRELQTAYDELKMSQAQVLQQEKMASIGQLAAGVAHEINNPVSFVTSNLGSMQKYVTRVLEYLKIQDELLPVDGDNQVATDLAAARKRLKIDYALEDMPALLTESLDGVERVRKIVQNLKSFSRIDQSDYIRTDINQCLEDTLNIAWNEIKYKCTVRKEYGELPVIMAYPQQLNQVFMNLLVNAAQAIEEKGEITIRTWATANSVKISVSDTGGGIPPENIHRIFEPFFTTKAVGKGTGLGLSIAYDIVTKKHGGKLKVTSRPGRGTTFVVCLPLKTV